MRLSFDFGRSVAHGARLRTFSAARWLGCGVLLVSTACSSPDTEARVDAVSNGPDKATFKPVATMLVRRCGSIDCHGAQNRNMRLYGYGGRRLDPNTLPDGPPMTDAESDADYEAVVGLEPELLPGVAASKGATASDLTFVRKGRGQENHKGGQRIEVGDDADRCLMSWFAGTVEEQANLDACTNASTN